MPCTDRNPLTREGTSQLNRVLAALDVHHADVDERTTTDLILFARRYAAYLNYFDENNSKDGDWQPLMTMDVSVTLATLSGINIKRISDYKKLLYKNIANATAPQQDSIAKRSLKFLFDTIFSVIKIIDNQLILLPNEDFKKTIDDIISHRLSLHLANFQETFFSSFKSAGLLDYSLNELDSDAPLEVVSDENFDRAQLSDAWQGVSPDLTITLPATGSDFEKIIYIINHNLFNGTIDSILKGTASIVSRATELLDKSLADFPQHTPHYGLYLAFIKIFKTVRDDLNHYTQRHLDFYFKDILQLKNKNALPDTAHLTFELQKPVQQQLLKKGILFKGGKDSTGKEITYALEEDVVLNKATVLKIQAQHIDSKNNRLNAFTTAQAENGEAAAPADKSWFTFGNPKSKNKTKAGFAFASNILFLNEGSRKITVTVTFETPVAEFKTLTGKNLACFEAALTAKKEWLTKNVSAVYDDPTGSLTFSVMITPNEPAIVPYSEKIHKQQLDINLPLLAIYLNQDAMDAIAYTRLSKQKISRVDVEVDVKGIKDLIVGSDAGPIDASKPFKPFGDFPAAGAGFYIGSKEVFQKKISELTIDFTGTNPFSTSTYYLDEAAWKPFASLSGKKIAGISVEPAAIDFTPNESLKATTLNGFLKLTNSTNKSIDTYLLKLKTALDGTMLHLVDASKPLEYKLTFGQPPSPDEIKISDFSLGYKASSSVDFTLPRTVSANNLFFQLTPFGYREVYNNETASGTSAAESGRYTLLEDINYEGELFIGIENAISPSVLTILFQVADGSSNPLKNMEVLNWFYLSKNEWVKFENRNVIDRTNNFTQSGVVTLTLPAAADNQNTLFQHGLHWIKVSVKKNIDAVCRMILIQAQAAAVTLVQDESNQIEFRNPLAAFSISKLTESNAAIKTVSQPFASFNGRTRESDEHYYVRVSERLRHKQRAITIWDYEHILLERFPQLFKVKCLNHSGFIEGTDKNVFCENLPGHVTIIPLPDLKLNTHSNPLKPYTPIGLLNNMTEYLEKITSPFVRLHVINPQFEEVQFDFEVKFYDNLDVSFYKQQLDKAIEEYLCPWSSNTGVEIPFGSKVTKSVVLNFVEELPYVEYLTCFVMHHLLRDGETILFEHRNIEEAVATTSRSVLVSYFNETNGLRHIINSPATCTC